MKDKRFKLLGTKFDPNTGKRFNEYLDTQTGKKFLTDPDMGDNPAYKPPRTQPKQGGRDLTFSYKIGASVAAKRKAERNEKLPVSPPSFNTDRTTLSTQGMTLHYDTSKHVHYLLDEYGSLFDLMNVGAQAWGYTHPGKSATHYNYSYFQERKAYVEAQLRGDPSVGIPFKGWAQLNITRDVNRRFPTTEWDYQFNKQIYDTNFYGEIPLLVTNKVTGESHIINTNYGRPQSVTSRVHTNMLADLWKRTNPGRQLGGSWELNASGHYTTDSLAPVDQMSERDLARAFGKMPLLTHLQNLNAPALPILHNRHNFFKPATRGQPLTGLHTVFDVETDEAGQPVQIALRTFGFDASGKVRLANSLDRFYMRTPGTPEGEATALTGLTDAVLQGYRKQTKAKYAEHYNEEEAKVIAQYLLNNGKLVGHNVLEFDLKKLFPQTWGGYDTVNNLINNNGIIDTLLLAESFRPRKKGYNDLGSLFKIAYQKTMQEMGLGAHGAIDDSIATELVYLAMMSRGGQMGQVARALLFREDAISTTPVDEIGQRGGYLIGGRNLSREEFLSGSDPRVYQHALDGVIGGGSGLGGELQTLLTEQFTNMIKAVEKATETAILNTGAMATSAANINSAAEYIQRSNRVNMMRALSGLSDERVRTVLHSAGYGDKEADALAWGIEAIRQQKAEKEAEKKEWSPSTAAIYKRRYEWDKLGFTEGLNGLHELADIEDGYERYARLKDLDASYKMYQERLKEREKLRKEGKLIYDYPEGEHPGEGLTPRDELRYQYDEWMSLAARNRHPKERRDMFGSLRESFTNAAGIIDMMDRGGMFSIGGQIRQAKEHGGVLDSLKESLSNVAELVDYIKSPNQMQRGGQLPRVSHRSLKDRWNDWATANGVEWVPDAIRKDIANRWGDIKDWAGERWRNLKDDASDAHLFMSMFGKMVSDKWGDMKDRFSEFMANRGDPYDIFRKRFMSNSVGFEGLDGQYLVATEAMNAFIKGLKEAGPKVKEFGKALGKSVLGHAANQEWFRYRQLAETLDAQTQGIVQSAEGFAPAMIRKPISHIFKAMVNEYSIAMGRRDLNLWKADTLVNPVISAVGAIDPRIGAAAQGIYGGIKGITQWRGRTEQFNMMQWGQLLQHDFNLLSASVMGVMLPLQALTKLFGRLKINVRGFVNMLRGGLDSITAYGNPWSPLTGVMAPGYASSRLADMAFGLQRGATNNSFNNWAMQRTGLYTLGELDTNRLVAAAMLGEFGSVYGGAGQSEQDYVGFMDRMSTRLRTATPEESARIMYLANKVDPNAPQVLTRLAAMGMRYSDAVDAGKRGVYYRAIDNNEMKSYYTIGFQWQAHRDQLNNSKMRIASLLWSNDKLPIDGNRLFSKFNKILDSAIQSLGQGDWKNALQTVFGATSKFWQSFKSVMEEAGIPSFKDVVMKGIRLVTNGIYDFWLELLQRLNERSGMLKYMLENTHFKVKKNGPMDFGIEIETPQKAIDEMHEKGKAQAAKDLRHGGVVRHVSGTSYRMPSSDIFLREGGQSVTDWALYQGRGYDVASASNNYWIDMDRIPDYEDAIGPVYIRGLEGEAVPFSKAVYDAIRDKGYGSDERGIKAMTYEWLNGDFSAYTDEEKTAIEAWLAMETSKGGRTVAELLNTLFPTFLPKEYEEWKKGKDILTKGAVGAGDILVGAIQDVAKPRLNKVEIIIKDSMNKMLGTVNVDTDGSVSTRSNVANIFIRALQSATNTAQGG